MSVDKMKKIAVITTHVALPGEKGYTRIRYVADLLAKNGYEVDLITSSFHHWSKQQRNLKNISNNELYKIKIFNAPGYKKNIDFRRLYNNHIEAKNLVKILETNEYDLLYVEIPPNNVALAAACYAKKKNIPIIVDVMDLWPEAMRMVIDIPVISDILFYPLYTDAENTYKIASGIIGTSDEYRMRPFKYQKRNIPSETVYVGNELEEFDNGVRENLSRVKKDQNDFWVTYAGTIGLSYNLDNLIEASKLIKERGFDNIKFKILGGGPLLDTLKNKALHEKCDVDFVGFMDYKHMAAYLYKSDLLVNSFQRKASQSIVTKIADYLAAGKPIINTLLSPEFCNKVNKDGFGINIEPENPKVLADAIIQLYNNKDLCKKMGASARYIAETQFDRKKSYIKILNMVESLLKNGK